LRGLPVAVAFAAAHGDDALAGADGDVVPVEGSQLGDAQGGEQQRSEDRSVPHTAGGAGFGAAFGGPQQPAGLLDAQRPRGGLGEVLAADPGGAEPEEAVEVVEGGEGEIDRGR